LAAGRRVVHGRCERREGAERDAFIAESCHGDDALRQEIESLLKAHCEATGFMQSPVINEAAD
jgi:hypothetical protein